MISTLEWGLQISNNMVKSENMGNSPGAEGESLRAKLPLETGEVASDLSITPSAASVSKGKNPREAVSQEPIHSKDGELLVFLNQLEALANKGAFDRATEISLASLKISLNACHWFGGWNDSDDNSGVRSAILRAVLKVERMGGQRYKDRLATVSRLRSKLASWYWRKSKRDIPVSRLNLCLSRLELLEHIDLVVTIKEYEGFINKIGQIGWKVTT